MQKLVALVSSVILGLLNPTAVILGLNWSKGITAATMAVNPLFSSKPRIAAPAVSQTSNQRSVEAESVSGGTVIADGDASGLQAVTRASDGTYTWWVLPSGNAPHGGYTAFVRARTADGQPHTFTEHVLSDETPIAILATSVNSSAYRWYRLGEFNFSGSTLRLSDWSNPSLVVDNVIIEPVQVVNAKDVSGGTLISDPGAVSGTAVTRTSDGLYTWWVLLSPASLPHGSYSVYVRARTQGVSSATFTEHIVVNGAEVAMLAAPVSSGTYQWIPLGSFDYLGSTLRIADYSNAGLVVDQVRLVQNKPLDPTLGLYHLWHGNAALSGVLKAEAENVAVGSVVDDPSASDGRAVTLSSTGHYLWWNVPPANLVAGALYSVDVRMRSTDAQTHIFGLFASPTDPLAHKDTGVASSSYQWYKGIAFFQYMGQELVLADWSEPGLAVDAIRLQLVSPQESGYQQIGFYAQGAPGTQGITTSPGRLSVLPLDNGQVYGYFRQTLPNNALDQHMGISNDGGRTFEVQPSPIISVTPNQIVPGFGFLSAAFDGSAYKTADGFYLVFEGGGARPISSLIAYSQDGVHNWSVQGALVSPPSAATSASTPYLIQDVETQTQYLQWVNVNDTKRRTTRHQASMSFLKSWNPGATWPSSGAIWSNPSIGQLQQSPPGSWDAANYGSGGVIYEDGYYYMTFEGADNYRCDGTWGLGLARITQANLADPSLWEKSSFNPLLMAHFPTSCWIAYPQIAKIGGGYYLYYHDPEVNWTPTNVNEVYRRAITINSN